MGWIYCSLRGPVEVAWISPGRVGQFHNYEIRFGYEGEGYEIGTWSGWFNFFFAIAALGSERVICGLNPRTPSEEQQASVEMTPLLFVVPGTSLHAMSNPAKAKPWADGSQHATAPGRLAEIIYQAL